MSDTDDSTPSAPAPRAGPAETEAIDAGQVERDCDDIAVMVGPDTPVGAVAFRLAAHCRALLAAWRAAEEERDVAIDLLANHAVVGRVEHAQARVEAEAAVRAAVDDLRSWRAGPAPREEGT
jgi:hypothetical protein